VLNGSHLPSNFHVHLEPSVIGSASLVQSPANGLPAHGAKAGGTRGRGGARKAARGADEEDDGEEGEGEDWTGCWQELEVIGQGHVHLGV
jgi:hypothetical protein